MSALSIQPTYPIFTDIDGQPLEAGYVWLGQANLDPQVNPINAYWDAALTIAAPQPIRTLGGYPSRNGTPARLYVNSDYSIRVQNRNGSTVYSAPTATERYNDVVISSINAQNVVYDPPFTGGVPTNAEAQFAQSVSVMNFGAKGDLVTNDYNAFVAAAAYLQAQGGGRLVIPFTPTGYSITCPSNNGPVCDFSNLNLVTIEGDGAYIRFENTYSSSQGNTLFQFNACNNIRIRGLFVFNNYTKTAVQSGVRFSYFTNECQGVSIDDVTFWGGLALMQVYKDPVNGYGPTNQARGFKIGRVRVKNAWYGINCQYNGDDFMVENLETDEVHRSYFIYGVKHHKVFIRSKNNIAEDVAISSIDGFGCENIDIDYINTDSTASPLGSRGACIDIGLNRGSTYPGPAVMRNIKVNVTATIVPNSMGYGFAINSGDAVAPGHVLENIELRGSFTSTWATFNPIHIGYVYPATGTNFLRNIRLRDIWVGGSAADSYINCRNISFMKLESVNTPAGCFLYGGSDGSKILVENSAATSFSNSAVDATAVQFVNTIMTTGAGQGLLNKTIQNSKISVSPLNMLPRVWAVLDPAGAIKQSVGVVSTSKVGTGVYAINFETSYSQGNYSGLANISGGALFCEVLQWSSTQARVQVFNTSGVLTDPANEIMFGLFANPSA